MDVAFWVMQLVIGGMLIMAGMYTALDGQKELGFIMIGVGNVLIGQTIHHARMEQIASQKNKAEEKSLDS